jgi:hypothetical protein
MAETVCDVPGNSPHRRWTVLIFLAWRRSFLRVVWLEARFSNLGRFRGTSHSQGATVAPS